MHKKKKLEIEKNLLLGKLFEVALNISGVYQKRIR